MVNSAGTPAFEESGASAGSAKGKRRMPGPKAPEGTRRQQILTAAYEVASRDGLTGLTVRGVAAQAKLSHGLVLFHFERREQLVSALLDGILARTLTLRIPEEIQGMPRALDRLRALLRHELHRLSEEPRLIRLLLDCWALGAREPVIRRKVSAALEGFREGFRNTLEEVFRTEPGDFADVTPEGLAAVAVGFIHAWAVQVAIDPDHFDIDEQLAVVEAFMGRLTSS